MLSVEGESERRDEKSVLNSRRRSFFLIYPGQLDECENYPERTRSWPFVNVFSLVERSIIGRLPLLDHADRKQGRRRSCFRCGSGPS
jgi:hypothetical protein